MACPFAACRLKWYFPVLPFSRTNFPLIFSSVLAFRRAARLSLTGRSCPASRPHSPACWVVHRVDGGQGSDAHTAGCRAVLMAARPHRARSGWLGSGGRVDLLDEFGQPPLAEAVGQVGLGDHADQAVVFDHRKPLDLV